MPITGVGPRITHCFCSSWLQIGDFYGLLPLDLMICLNSSQNSGQHFHLPLYDVIKDTMKDTDQQPDEETHRARCVEGVRNFHALSGHATFPDPTCSAALKLSKPRTLGIFMEPSPHRHDGSLTPFPASAFSLENQGWVGLKIPSFSSWLDLSGDQPHPGGIQEPLRVTSLEQDTPITRKFQGIWELCGRNQGQRPNFRKKKDAPSSLILGNDKGFRSSGQELEVETNTCVFYFTEPLLYHSHTASFLGKPIILFDLMLPATYILAFNDI